MNLPVHIAGRYLTGKKSHNVINWISAVSVAGIAIGTAALVVILSVYNGFDGIIREKLAEASADIAVRPSQGKFFDSSEAEMKLEGIEGIESIARVVEDRVFISYNGAQCVATAKGIEGGVSAISSGIAKSTGWFRGSQAPVGLYYPFRDRKFSVADPMSGLNQASFLPEQIFGAGEGQAEIIMPISDMQDLLQLGDLVSGLELTLKPGAGDAATVKEVSSLLGDGFEVLDRAHQFPAVFKMMKYEKGAIFLILIFMVFIVAFNIYASLSMLILEKKEDIFTLGSIGAGTSLTGKIFRTEGFMITLLGVAIGLAAGLAAVLLQKSTGFAIMPGTFMAYPVQMRIPDIALSVAGVLAIGAFISIISVKNIHNTTL